MSLVYATKYIGKPLFSQILFKFYKVNFGRARSFAVRVCTKVESLA